MGNNDSRLRSIWHNMKTRCSNENYDKYDRYGGRGISICDEWYNSFKTFETWALEHGYSDELTLDRIDNDKDYSPDNCRWVTRKEQANNRSTSVFITIGNITKTMQQWAEEYNQRPASISRRIKAGWDPKDAVTIPAEQKFNIKRLYDYNGLMLPIKRISKLSGIKDSTLRKYLNKGYTIEEALAKIQPKQS